LRNSGDFSSEMEGNSTEWMAKNTDEREMSIQMEIGTNLMRSEGGKKDGSLLRIRKMTELRAA